MKITQKNRSFVFLIGTILIALLFIGVLMLYENNDESDDKRNEPPTAKLIELEKKIDDLKNQNFNPDNYNTIAANITSNLKQDLITGSAKNYLMGRLNVVYSDLVYGRCESFLNGNNQDKSGDLLNWLTQLETITSRNSKIDHYRGQIIAYDDYSTGLPSRVNNFISRIDNYKDSDYKSYKEEADKMPKLDMAYRGKSKFVAIRKDLIDKLDKFNAEFYNSAEISAP